MHGTKAFTIIDTEGWRNTTFKGIKLSQAIVQRSDNCDIGRFLDPLLQFRDTFAQLSNEEIHRYARVVRCAVTRLRESLLETNEEIKSLTRVKEDLEMVIEHTQKDIHSNKECQENRLLRPAPEKESDGADDLLNAERSHWLSCKKTLDAQLRSVQQQLHIFVQPMVDIIHDKALSIWMHLAQTRLKLTRHWQMHMMLMEGP